MTETRIVKLRPCPFCQAFGKDHLFIETIQDDDGSLAYAVVCNNCGSMGPAVQDMSNARNASIETCVELWNGVQNGRSEDDPQRQALD